MGLLDKIKRFLGITPQNRYPLDPSQPSEINENAVSQGHQQAKEDISTEPYETAKEFITGTVEEVKQQGSQIWETVKDGLESIDDATQPFRDKLVDKAKEVSEKIETVIESTLEKAKILEEEVSKSDKDKDGFSDTPIDFGKTVTEKHEGFFDKAEDWLEKNEDTKKDDSTKEPESNKPITPLELPKE